MFSNVLKKIIEEKKKWIIHRKKFQSLKLIRKNINYKNERNFLNSINNNSTSFILEIKKSTPLKGIIRKNFDFVHISKMYERYADAISIVTEEKYFSGNIENIPKIKKILSKPVLCKDFIIDPYQIYLAKYYQADAILLMMSILKDNEYLYLYNLAKKNKLSVITEIHTLEELQRLKKFNPEIIGINNRNLHNLKIDLNNTINLAPLIKKNVCIISESGIRTNKDIKKLKIYAKNFLIGTNILKKKNLEHSIKKIIYGKNKICGLTSNKDAYYSNIYGAIYGGLIFCKNSPRYVDINSAINIMNSINLNFIGVFQNLEIKNLINIVNKLELKFIQLHGEENEEYFKKLKKNISKKIKIFKFITLTQFLKNSYSSKYINLYLLDNKNPGSGIPLEWKCLKKKNLKKIILAGGLKKNNLKKLNKLKLNFYGLDFNSGVENFPGKKNKKKIKSLFKYLKNM